ncbi:MAG TPA: hypothetical protein VGU01_02875 [Sphingomicrobium sp.]|nr:hypothetical protein [Sphingomicrobium sp.]
MKLSTIAGAVPFAHLLGLSAAKAADDKDNQGDASRAEGDDDERKQRADESDDDYAKRMEEQDKKDEEARKAEEEKKDEEAKKAEEDRQKDEAARANGSATAVVAERERCAKIVAHGIANGCVRQAGIFAFDTDMSASQAIAALSAAAEDGKNRPSGLRERMSGVRVPNVGTDGGAGAAADPNDPKAKANAIILAGKKRRGEV